MSEEPDAYNLEEKGIPSVSVESLNLERRSEDRRQIENKVMAATAITSKRSPGYATLAILVVFLVVALVGILGMTQQARSDRIFQCQRVNRLQATLAEILISSEQSVSADRYTSNTKVFYDNALRSLKFVKCTGTNQSIGSGEFPVRPDRPVEQR